MTRTQREMPAERAVALVFNGATEAVLMATPRDLDDLIRGFALSEGIVDSVQDLSELETVQHDIGFEVRARVGDEVSRRLDARRRRSVGPVGCGLCGIDSLEAAMRQVPRAPHAQSEVLPRMVAARGALSAAQTARRQARGGMHAAAFVDARGLQVMREDVGRHNALDKLIGALQGHEAHRGGVLITSRLSLDLVQKCLAAGIPILIGMGAATDAAASLAQRSGLVIGRVGDGWLELIDHHVDAGLGAAH